MESAASLPLQWLLSNIPLKVLEPSFTSEEEKEKIISFYLAFYCMVPESRQDFGAMQLQAALS